jgi:hypothetical protein
MPWSDELIEQTREAILEGFTAPDGYLHFKNFYTGYAKLSQDNLYARRFILEDKLSDSKFEYETEHDLIKAGWAID